MIGRAVAQLWMRRLDDRAAVDAILRHPAFRDRAPAEKALSRLFFAPFAHQEVVTGDRFAARARWSRAALSLPVETAVAATDRAFSLRAREGLFDSLLDEVRRVVTRTTVELVFGPAEVSDEIEACALAAVRDFDRAIKLVAPGHPAPRRRLAKALAPLLETPERWQGGSYLALGREEARTLPLDERIDHVASVFLGTGIIQITDVVTHALVAEAQHPSGADDAAVVRTIVRAYPVNASITRLANRDAVVAGLCFRRGEAVTVVPRRLNGPPDRARDDGFAFGVGPRACPARRLALAVATALVGRYRALGVRVEPGYRHRRSLAQPVRVRLGPGTPPFPTPGHRQAAFWLRHLATAAVSYPRAARLAAPEIAALL